MTELLSLLKDFGFPSAIALIILLRIEPRLDKLRDAIVELPQRLHELTHINRGNPGPTSTTSEGATEHAPLN